MHFISDGSATVCPEIMDAIAAANRGHVFGYGEDPWTQRLDGVFGGFFGKPVRVFPVSTGTAANCLALATATPPWGAVFAHDEAHILRDECSAPEFFTSGARIVALPGRDAKLTAETVSAALEANPVSVHSIQPAAVSITQATERGTVYRPAEIEALSRIARARDLVLHMDGARFANALVSLGCEPADITWRAGVDVLSFGATKNGALTAEAVVFFREELVREFELRRKRAGHLLAKSRYISAQLLAYVETGVWRRNAERANRLAGHIAAAAQPWLLHPVEANQVFMRLGEPGKRALRDQGFVFYDWGAADSGIARFVAAWDQDEQDVRKLVQALQRLATTASGPR
jgi:threonine aldolase